MRFQTKLMAAAGGVALITLAVSLLGYWQASRLGTALYEVGVVRLPSIEGLTLLREAKSELDASATVLSGLEPGDALIRAEQERQAQAWERAGRGLAIYAPLPQTPEEASTWGMFMPAWATWKAAYDAAAVEGQGPSDLGRLSSEVDALLARLLEINDRIVVEARQRSVDSYDDLARVRTVMLVVALVSVLGAIGVGYLLGRQLARPLVDVAASLSRIAQGTEVAPLAVTSRDEIGEIATGVNELIARQRATEAERGRAEDARRRSEERFSKVFMSAPVCMVISELATGRLTDVNEEFVRLLGYGRDELIGRVSTEVGLWPDPRARDALVGRLRQKGESRDDEQWLRARDGRILTVRAFAHALDLDGVSFLVSTFIDTTARKQTEEALRISEERFSKVFMSAPVGISVTGLSDARILEANDEFLRLLGYNRDEVVGRSSLDLGIWANAADRDALAATLREHGTASRELQLQAKSGEVRTVRATTHVVEINREPLILSAVADVTEQRRAEAERRRSEQLYRELVDGARDVIFAVTPDGVLTALNPVFEQLTGWPPTEWIGHSFVGLVVPDDVQKALALFQAVLRDEPCPVTQLRTRTAGGHVQIAEVYLAPQRANGRIVGALGIARNVTDRVQLEEAFHQAQKMEAVGRLAGGVAHDFNNLLTAILGYCELLMADLDPRDPRFADVSEIHKAGTRAAGLTRQLLAFSRKQIIEPASLDLNAIVADIRPMLERLIGEDVAVVLRLQSGLGCVMADQGQVEQVIVNLAVNARDAMPTGGTLTLETATLGLDDDAARHTGVSPGSYVVLTVTDTGTGMTPEVQARLFEPFFTTKGVGKGTGLGLATVHGIVARNGGSVEVRSALGEGSSFRVYFPASDTAGSADDVPAPTTRSRPQGETVLVVEDADELRDLATRQLRRQGYTVLAASSADEALRLFDANPAIDLVLTDVVMPGASGPALAAQLMARRPRLKVIYMSGYTEETIVDHGVINPGISFLNKPFTSDALGRKIREALEARSSG